MEFLTTDLETWRPIVTKVVDGKFPNAERLLKDNKVGRKKWRTDVWFNPEYMKKICDLYEKAGVKAIKLSVRKTDDPMRLMARIPETGQLVTALLMPMKGFEGSLEKPKKERQSTATATVIDNETVPDEGIDT